MAVLGKRTRSSAGLADSQDSQARTTPSSRAKRHASSRQLASFVIASDNDDEENPFITTTRRSARKTVKKMKNFAVEDDDMEVDELSVDNENAGRSPLKQSKRRKVVIEMVPAKHGSPERRVAIPTPSAGSTPSTPRHGDALATKRISVPVTPRHRVGIVGKPLTPQTNRTPGTPRTSFPSIYDDARRVFKGSVSSGKLIGRESEKEELLSFVSKRVASKTSGCLYISGPPGTGKSALVNEVCDELKHTADFRMTWVNCMTAKNANAIYGKLLEDFSNSDVLQGDETTALESVFRAKEFPYVVVLDEIDFLLDLDLELLYRLFEISLGKSSSLILVGIANALDLTDRFLPRLKSKGMKAQLLPVMPYSVQQLAKVMTTKLKSLLPEVSTAAAAATATGDFVPFIHPMAIQFVSKKVAAQTGDVRKAFAICIRSLDIIESETRTALEKQLTPSPSPSKTPLMDNINLSSPPTSRSPKKASQVRNVLAHLSPETAPRATIAHVARVTAAIFSNGASQRLAALNLQQKAALCALAGFETRLRDSTVGSSIMAPATPSKSANLAPTVRMLYDCYARLCRQENVLQPLTMTEFRDVLASLETLSLISWVDGKNGSLVVSASMGTPSRKGRGRGRGNGFGSISLDGQRVASSIGTKEIKTSLTGPGSSILMALIDGEWF